MRSPKFWAYRSIVSWFLSPIGSAFGYAAALRARCVHSFQINHPVICVGNLVAGGAGKTPIAISIADRLHSLGYTPHFLTRGYGGSIIGPECVDLGRHTAIEVGDESLLLARLAPTWVSRNRVTGALAAEAAGADVIVMDDGFQNHDLKKDISLVVIDGVYGMGNGRVIPAGPLREFPDHGLSRADAIVVIGPISESTSAALPENIPIFKASIVPADKQIEGSSRVVAFAGIGFPEKFYASLLTAGAEIIETRSFPDHYFYSKQDIIKLKSTASKHDAKLVTTEKDFARLDASDAQGIDTLPVSVEWQDRTAFDDFLTRISMPS